MSEFQGFYEEEEEVQDCPECQSEIEDIHYLVSRFFSEAEDVKGDEELENFLRRVVTISHAVGRQSAFEDIAGLGANVSESLDEVINEMLNGEEDCCECDCCCEDECDFE